jgi:hypothetical protein
VMQHQPRWQWHNQSYLKMQITIPETHSVADLAVRK